MSKHELLQNLSFTYIGRDGTAAKQSEDVLVEHSISVIVNGVPFGNITCIPEHLELLILGRLLTEGFLASMGDVTAIRIPEDGRQAEIQLAQGTAPTPQYAPLKGNHTGNDGYIVSDTMQSVVPIHWEPEWIFALADYFAAGTPLHEKTWATHSCILAKGNQILFTCEDISRHNALDKVIGYALKHSIPLQECTVYSSGRIPTDMAAKAIRAGIPILVSKASPTAAAVALAKKYQLTLICAARKDRMKLFAWNSRL